MAAEESNQLAAAEENWAPGLMADAMAARGMNAAREEEDAEEGKGALEEEARRFRDTWNSKYSPYYGRFEDTTKIPNKRYTFEKPEPDRCPTPTTTLQIFSLKVLRTLGNLQWPLHVFGKVAIRDGLDHNRNMVFDRPRESCQILTREVPYLKLTGPTRAVVLDPLTFEVDLKVKGTTESEDKCLSFLAVTHHDYYTSFYSRLVKMSYASKLSTLEFEVGSIVHSVEATVAVRIRRGSWPDGFRAQFAARTASIRGAEVILLDSADDGVAVGSDGSIALSRCVVSVEIIGKLEVCVKARRGDEKKRIFSPREDGATHGILRLGFCTLDVTVYWSLVSFET